MIEAIPVITSPLYQYLKVESYYAFNTDFPKEDIIFYHSQYYLIKDSSNNREKLEEIFKSRGITIRFSYENWPFLEDDAWQKTNKINKY